MKSQYPELEKLGVRVYEDPVEHVSCADIDAALPADRRQEFNRLFGIQTCPVVPRGPALYPWDAEAVLVRMFRNRLQGSQLHWD